MLNRAKAALAATAMLMSAAAVAAPPTPVYVAKAGAGDAYEKRSSQLVLSSTRNPEIRRFANMMVRDHTKSTNEVKAAAGRSGVRARPPVLEPKQRRMIADLNGARGRERDRIYIEQQRMAHQEALALHRDYARTGASRPLRNAAGQIVPVVQHHIDMLSRMSI